MLRIIFIFSFLVMLIFQSTIAELKLDSFSFQDYYPEDVIFDSFKNTTWLRLDKSQSLSYKKPSLVINRDSNINQTTASTYITKDTPALAYPNPFKFLNGVEIGFYSSEVYDARFYVYDMLGHLRIKKDIVVSNTSYNLISLSPGDFEGGSVPAGAYFYVLVRDNEIVRKGKMGVIP